LRIYTQKLRVRIACSRRSNSGTRAKNKARAKNERKRGKKREETGERLEQARVRATLYRIINKIFDLTVHDHTFGFHAQTQKLEPLLDKTLFLFVRVKVAKLRRVLNDSAVIVLFAKNVTFPCS